MSMCGPIAITVNNNNGYLGFYHLGRLLSYLFLGAIAGYFGEKLLASKYQVVSIASAILISIFLILSGYKLIRQKTLDLSFSKKLTSFLFIPAKWARTQNPAVKSLTIGIVNGFLPCGWLYVFVLGSIATKDALYGAILLAIFWLGTIPALTVFAIFYKKFFYRFPSKLNQIAGIILVIVGLANITLLIVNRLMPAIHSAHHIVLHAL
ncbi:MAG: sulfite exporter TauE/SafE family protein [Deltaproteobacteria bacterium]|nr:sulfite exporter TauE/SafE family protein [Deltaproteobacteria bacterium]